MLWQRAYAFQNQTEVAKLPLRMCVLLPPNFNNIWSCPFLVGQTIMFFPKLVFSPNLLCEKLTSVGPWAQHSKCVLWLSCAPEPSICSGCTSRVNRQWTSGLDTLLESSLYTPCSSIQGAFWPFLNVFWSNPPEDSVSC